MDAEDEGIQVRPSSIHFFFNMNKLNKNTEAEIAQKIRTS